MRLVWDAGVRDWLDYDDELLVLHSRQLLRLGPIGAAIFRLCQEEQTVPEVAEAIRNEFGDPPTGDLEAVVKQMVADLISQCVLQDVG